MHPEYALDLNAIVPVYMILAITLNLFEYL